MKTLCALLLLLSYIICGDPRIALAENELMKISAAKKPNSVQIYFTFLNSPRFNTNVDKRRIDIQFAKTKVIKDFQQLSTGNDIVKILTRNFQGQLIFSFFFRYQPQDFRVDPSIKNTIVLNVTLGNEYSKSYKDLEKRLKGLSIVDRSSINFTNPYIHSPYSDDWLSFFRDFEPKVKISIPVTFTPPPFPIIRLLPPGMENNMTVLSEEHFSLAAQGLWRQLAATLVEKIHTTEDLQQQKLLALVYGETLARAGDFTPAYQQLYLLNEKYKEEELAVYATYWLNLLRAIKENPLVVEYEFDKFAEMVPKTSPLAPYYLLSRVETTLVSKNYKKLNTFLQEDDIAFPKEVESRLIIRQADYWKATDQPIKAYAAYNLLTNSTLITSQPHSYNNFCETLYAQNKFQDAAACYNTMTNLITDPDTLGLLSYQEQIAKLQYTEPSKLIRQFEFIISTYPETESQCLAEMKKTDILLLQNPTQAGNLIDIYRNLAKQCPQRNIREAAKFKEILLHAHQNNTSTAINMALQFIREFQSGEVRMSAQALLIQLVPEEIQRLVEKKDYMQALVLARQNRELFEKNWIDNTFLLDIAEAYQYLGLFDEAQKLYLYLIEIIPLNKREHLYPKMIEAAQTSGNYSLLDEYAAQYAYTYPTGRYENDIIYLRLQALLDRNQLDDAANALPSPLPREGRFYRLKANIMFQLDRYADCMNALNKLEIIAQLTPTEQFMLAESLFQTKNYERALLEYEILPQDHQFRDQILYRLAEIARINGEEEKALSLLDEIAEKGKNNFWKDLAERELQYNAVKDIF